MLEKLNLGASICAVLVSVFSTVVSCTSQADLETIRQGYSICNTKLSFLNSILQNQFRQYDDAAVELSVLMYNPNGIPQLPTDPAMLPILTKTVAAVNDLPDRIGRESIPYMTGLRKKELVRLYDNKRAASNAITENQNRGIINNASGVAALASINEFMLKAPGIIAEEIEFTTKSSDCLALKDAMGT